MTAKAYVVCLVALLSFAVPSQAAIVFTNLGTDAPPAALGPVSVTPFNIAPQAAIPDFTVLNAIPGSPFGGLVGLSTAAIKFSIPDSWGTWSHGYVGPVFGFKETLIDARVVCSTCHVSTSRSTASSVSVVATGEDVTRMTAIAMAIGEWNRRA